MRTERRIPVHPESSGFEILIGTILRTGVWLSMAFLSAGILWHWLLTGQPEMDYSMAGTNLFQFWINDIRLLAAGAVRPRFLVNLGIAVLMLTPFARVAASLVYFALIERNRKYILFTGFVLTVLTYSLFLR